MDDYFTELISTTSSIQNIISQIHTLSKADQQSHIDQLSELLTDGDQTADLIKLELWADKSADSQHLQSSILEYTLV